MSTPHVIVSNLGYPRIGASREWKKALESFWAGKTEEPDFRAEMRRIQLAHWSRQQELGVELIPVGDFTLYDLMLDTAAMFGIVPARYAYDGGEVSLKLYFEMARGSGSTPACSMKKWFNTNYHYIVPEIGGRAPELKKNKPLEAFRLAKEELGIIGKPVVIGLFTFLKLSRGIEAGRLAETARRFLTAYAEMLKELEREGADWVQIDEPAIVTGLDAGQLELLQEIYSELSQAAPGLRLLLQTYFEAAVPLDKLTRLPVAGIGLDFVHDGGASLEWIERYGWPAGLALAAGIVDGRNIWRSELGAKLELAERLSGLVPSGKLLLQPSCSLIHVPVTAKKERKLKAEIRGALAFAEEKLEELAVIGRGLSEGRAAVAAEIADAEQALSAFRSLPERSRGDVAETLRGVEALAAPRALGFAERSKLQAARWRLPLLPTTTIGSFPQTAEVRKARQSWRLGVWSEARYREFIRGQIREAVEIQEKLGLDVLVHGEFERTDMVEFFGEKLAGFVFTSDGWVQSYGSRCVKPPVIYADVAYTSPMTVEESVYAQSLTRRPVKGMLTGPVTILNWSFVRDDLAAETVTYQIAAALRQEVLALEEAGIGMIQIDEPAVREGLPLKSEQQAHYLDWAIRAFRIAAGGVSPETQIHTHMCYCEFSDMLEPIRAMDADVISIESSRSHGELISSFEEQGYENGIGLGVYDIHSPRVPSAEEMTAYIDRALRVLRPELFWINPDCGLKTRGWPETEAALAAMVEAAERSRRKLGQPEQDWRSGELGQPGQDHRSAEVKPERA